MKIQTPELEELRRGGGHFDNTTPSKYGWTSEELFIHQQRCLHTHPLQSRAIGRFYKTRSNYQDTSWWETNPFITNWIITQGIATSTASYKRIPLC